MSDMNPSIRRAASTSFDFDIPMQRVVMSPAVEFAVNGIVPQSRAEWAVVSFTLSHAIDSLVDRKNRCVYGSEAYEGHMAAIRVLIDAQHRMLLEGIEAERRNDKCQYDQALDAAKDAVDASLELGELVETDGEIGLPEWGTARRNNRLVN
jgi:hypothetical protein